MSTVIRHALSFVDGSGVEALIEVNGIRFACSDVGPVWAREVSCIETRRLSRMERARAREFAQIRFSVMCVDYESRWM